MNTLFTKLLPLLVSLDVALDIKRKDNDILRVIVKFKMKDEKDEFILLNPLVLQGTAEDLDNELIDSLLEHLNHSVPSVANQIDLLTKNLQKVLDDKTNKASGKKSTTKKSETKDVAPAIDFDKPVVEEKIVEKPKRKRRTKAEIDAEKKAEELVEETVKPETKIVEEAQTETETKGEENLKILEKEVPDLFEVDAVDKAELEKEDDSTDDEDDNPWG